MQTMLSDIRDQIQDLKADNQRLTEDVNNLKADNQRLTADNQRLTADNRKLSRDVLVHGQDIENLKAPRKGNRETRTSIHTPPQRNVQEVERRQEAS